MVPQKPWILDSFWTSYFSICFKNVLWCSYLSNWSKSYSSPHTITLSIPNRCLQVGGKFFDRIFDGKNLNFWRKVIFLTGRMSVKKCFVEMSFWLIRQNFLTDNFRRTDIPSKFSWRHFLTNWHLVSKILTSFFDGLTCPSNEFLTEILTDFGVRQKLLQEGAAWCGRYFWRAVMAGSVKNFDGKCTYRQKIVHMRLKK